MLKAATLSVVAALALAGCIHADTPLVGEQFGPIRLHGDLNLYRHDIPLGGKLIVSADINASASVDVVHLVVNGQVWQTKENPTSPVEFQQRFEGTGEFHVMLNDQSVANVTVYEPARIRVDAFGPEQPNPLIHHPTTIQIQLTNVGGAQGDYGARVRVGDLHLHATGARIEAGTSVTLNQTWWPRAVGPIEAQLWLNGYQYASTMITPVERE